jgi:hypothetical protein
MCRCSAFVVLLLGMLAGIGQGARIVSAGIRVRIKCCYNPAVTTHYYAHIPGKGTTKVGDECFDTFYVQRLICNLNLSCICTESQIFSRSGEFWSVIFNFINAVKGIQK